MLTSSILSLTQDNLMSYINEVQSFQVLSLEEEEKLAKNWYEHGVIADAHKLVTSHLRLVVKVALSFKNYGLPLIELIMEGNIGLMQAVKKFNPNLGFRLSTYAIWWIKASIKDYILKSWSCIKIGTTQAQRKLFFSLRKIKKKLLKYHNNITKEDIKMIANECSTSEQEVEQMNKYFTYRDKSLNDVVFSNGSQNGVQLQDMIKCEDPNQEDAYLLNEETDIKKSLITQALATLNERHRDIFIRRKLIEEPDTLEILSKKYNISKERIRQIETHAFLKVKNFVISKRKEFGFHHNI
ncbi:sigma-70 family RNA polymerase sigma factor [Ehrlichia ruminantium]|nr:RNA polymerase factor sigma-32 [Ehrlichia ruminantium]QLK50473.1 sigma-70 family RNA polymerase sigma factor [Ehrlichia ruminantium]QLK51398.1 sigma-70 family RNA polymerase sigma factor [Ehrlichia ruminantium]QLK53232.1 sigma-70 family RNA polymerase sigma factor [Ehrlichia ruminantium]QLK55071.1 sigma-70 family RNA polymerase sigma factor [Ehrlichia ruminantium]QLK55988.1 sigma-70 family RNA polymerase sigma factor [Ehrlichia ruminantium]